MEQKKENSLIISYIDMLNTVQKNLEEIKAREQSVPVEYENLVTYIAASLILLGINAEEKDQNIVLQFNEKLYYVDKERIKKILGMDYEKYITIPEITTEDSSLAIKTSDSADLFIDSVINENNEMCHKVIETQEEDNNNMENKTISEPKELIKKENDIFEWVDSIEAFEKQSNNDDTNIKKRVFTEIRGEVKPEIPFKDTLTLQDDVEENKRENNYFIYNRHTLQIYPKHGMSDEITVTVYPLEYANDKIPVSILAIIYKRGVIRTAYSQKNKMIFISFDDINFIVNGKWLDGKFISNVSKGMIEDEKRDFEMQEIKCEANGGEIYPKNFGKTIKLDKTEIEIFPADFKNNIQSGLTPAIAFVYENGEKRIISTDNSEILQVDTLGKFYKLSCYFMADAFFVQIE